MAKNVLEVSEQAFGTEVLEAKEPVLVDFWAPWCGPCLRLGPIVEEVATEMAGKAKVVKVNIDEAPGLADQYDVTSIPQLVVFKGGEERVRSVGVVPKAAIKQMVEKAL